MAPLCEVPRWLSTVFPGESRQSGGSNVTLFGILFAVYPSPCSHSEPCWLEIQPSVGSGARMLSRIRFLLSGSTSGAHEPNCTHVYNVFFGMSETIGNSNQHLQSGPPIILFTFPAMFIFVSNCVTKPKRKALTHFTCLISSHFLYST